jgi:hypothetical protein
MSDVADADSHLRVNRRIVRNTVAANYLGAITLPVGRNRAGMPVGLQLTAPANVIRVRTYCLGVTIRTTSGKFSNWAQGRKR